MGGASSVKGERLWAGANEVPGSVVRRPGLEVCGTYQFAKGVAWAGIAVCLG